MTLGGARRWNAIVDAHARVLVEVRAATLNWAPFNSAHEAYAVLLEEVRELEFATFLKQADRDLGEMRREAIQVAAMAIRYAAEVCNEETGRK